MRQVGTPKLRDFDKQPKTYDSFSQNYFEIFRRLKIHDLGDTLWTYMILLIDQKSKQRENQERLDSERSMMKLE